MTLSVEIKCTCGHNFYEHHYGPPGKNEEMIGYCQQYEETRINCRICECPKFIKKHFWKKTQKYPSK